MKTTEMLELERALQKLQLILDCRYGDHEYTPWAGPTELGELPAAAREVARRKVDEANESARERAAIHFSLTSSIMLVGVAQRLMSASVHLSPKERAERLRQLTRDLRTAAQTAYRAGLMVLNAEPCLPWCADGREATA
ncbi:hypothetical protein QTI66_36395 [Variovorax sp. J22R133]|uniref:hypothetical protein n=1 Tax=Variovorax brevis TaxID=3053503 RepID=UPI002578AB74|nr:hypothetical protein [Variovorax sp. J22R133]MDM0117595.1 hypothetical protein [Variovorax sp. J22R133]